MSKATPKKFNRDVRPQKASTVPVAYIDVRSGIVEMLNAARQTATRNINALMTASYWEIGRRIVEAEQKGKRRAGYGEQLIERLSLDLTQQFGRGFSARNLEQMRQFYLTWAIPQTVSAELPKQLTTAVVIKKQTASAPVAWSELANAFSLPWSAYVRLLSVKDDHARQFYERTALSKNKAAMLIKAAVAKPEDAISPDEAVKDPYVLEFLNLKDEYSESELEAALIHRLEDFLLELGSDFTFVGRQRRLRIDQTWYRVDLLFFHRRLRCLVIIDLKLSSLTHADVGQMHMYCNYAKENWTLEGENPPVGLILCADKGHALARYALDGLPTAEYRRCYFLTDEGMTKIRDASPCTRRNRTLSLSKLMDLNVPSPIIELSKALVHLLRFLNAFRLIRSHELIENKSVVPALVNRLMA